MYVFENDEKTIVVNREEKKPPGFFNLVKNSTFLKFAKKNA